MSEFQKDVKDEIEFLTESAKDVGEGVLDVLDYGANVTRGVMVGKGIDAFKEKTSGSELTGIKVEKDDSIGTKARKELTNFAAEVATDPLIFGTAIKGGVKVLTGAIKQVGREIKINKVIKNNEEFLQELDRLSEANKRPGSTTHEELKKTAQDEILTGKTSEQKVFDREIADPIQAHTNEVVKIYKDDHLLNIQDLLDQADRPGDVPELVEGVMADIVNLARLQGKTAGIAQEAGLTLEALRDADVGAEALAAMTKGLAKYDAPTFVNLLKSHVNSGRPIEDFIKAVTKPGADEFFNELLTGNILGPGSFIAAAGGTQSLILSDIFDVALAGSGFAKGEARALFTGWFEGLTDLAHFGMTKIPGATELLQLKNRPETIIRFNLAQKRSIKDRFGGSPEGAIRQENLPFETGNIVGASVNLLGKASRFWSKSIGMVDDIAKYQEYKMRLYQTRVIHAQDERLLGKSTMEQLSIIESNPQAFKIPNIYDNTLQPFTAVARNAATDVSLAKPLGALRAITKNPLFRFMVTPFADVGMRSVEKLAQKLPVVNRISANSRKAISAGGRAGALDRARITQGTILALAGISLYELGILTPQGPRGRVINDAWSEAHGTPMSLRLFGNEVDISRIDPINHWLTWAADASDYISWLPDEGIGKYFEAYGYVLADRALSSTFFEDASRTLQDFRRAAQDDVSFSQAMSPVAARKVMNLFPLKGTIKFGNDATDDRERFKRNSEEFNRNLEQELRGIGLFRLNHELEEAMGPELAELSGLAQLNREVPESLPQRYNIFGYIQFTKGYTKDIAVPGLITGIPKSASPLDKQKMKDVVAQWKIEKMPITEEWAVFSSGMKVSPIDQQRMIGWRGHIKNDQGHRLHEALYELIQSKEYKDAPSRPDFGENKPITNRPDKRGLLEQVMNEYTKMVMDHKQIIPIVENYMNNREQLTEGFDKQIDEGSKDPLPTFKIGR